MDIYKYWYIWWLILKNLKKNPSLEITVLSVCLKLCDYCSQTDYISNYKKKFSNEDIDEIYTYIENDKELRDNFINGLSPCNK